MDNTSESVDNINEDVDNTSEDVENSPTEVTYVADQSPSGLINAHPWSELQNFPHFPPNQIFTKNFLLLESFIIDLTHN